MKHTDQFRKDMITCLDCFTGADGGGTFVKFKIGMETIAAKADEGEMSSKEVCKIVSRFARLINIMNE